MSINGVNSWIFGLNSLNAGLGGLNNYLDAKNAGASTGDAVASGTTTAALNFGRVAVAESMRQDYGNYMGYAVNNLAGWNGPQSNAVGYAGLFGVGMMQQMMRPYGFGNPFGMCGGTMFGSPMMMNPYMMPGMGMFGGGFGFYC